MSRAETREIIFSLTLLGDWAFSFSSDLELPFRGGWGKFRESCDDPFLVVITPTQLFLIAHFFIKIVWVNI